MVQHRKLHDHDPRMTALADKVGVKHHVSRTLGADWVIPTYWSGPALPQEPLWPYPFILKASHGCNQNIVCLTPSDWQAARRKAARWARKPYGLWLDEWAYRDVPRGYIVEPFLSNAGALPIDYKIYVFGGKAGLIQMHIDREHDHKWILFDPAWHQISMFGEKDLPPAPGSLPAMLRSAETLAEPFDFARVDFYEIGGEPKFGEVTFYPGSGLDPFDPRKLDLLIGELWRSAQGASAASHHAPVFA